MDGGHPSVQKLLERSCNVELTISLFCGKASLVFALYNDEAEGSLDEAVALGVDDLASVDEEPGVIFAIGAKTKLSDPRPNGHRCPSDVAVTWVDDEILVASVFARRMPPPSRIEGPLRQGH